MKNFILFLFCFIVSASTFAQGTPRDSVIVVEPQNFPVETNLPGDVAFYTRESNTNRKVNLDDIFDSVIATDGGTIAYTPTPTGNAQNRNQFVTTASGDVYFIDVNGMSIQFASGGSGDADSDPNNEIQTADGVSVVNGTFSGSTVEGSLEAIQADLAAAETNLSAHISSDNDTDATNEIQILSFANGILGLSGSGGTADLSVINTDNQTLSITNDLLTISDGNNVDLQSYSNDNQTLSYNSSSGELSISGTGGGNTVTVTNAPQIVTSNDNSVNVTQGVGVNDYDLSVAGSTAENWFEGGDDMRVFATYNPFISDYTKNGSGDYSFDVPAGEKLSAFEYVVHSSGGSQNVDGSSATTLKIITAQGNTNTLNMSIPQGIGYSLSTSTLQSLSTVGNGTTWGITQSSGTATIVINSVTAGYPDNSKLSITNLQQ